MKLIAMSFCPISETKVEFVMICNDDNDELAGQGRTLICHSSVLNLGDNPYDVAGGSITDVTANMPKK